MDITEGVKTLFNSSVQTEDKLASASHSELFSMRENSTGTEQQNILAKYEHRAFAREWVGETGPIAAASLAVAVPAYAAAKAVGILPSDEKTSTDYAGEIKQGFIGIGEGLLSYFQGETKSLPVQESVSVKTDESSAKSGVDSLFDNLIQVESGGQHSQDGFLIKSDKGALGITQIMPKTASNPGYGVKPLMNDSEEEYLRFGRDYLKAMYRVFQDKEQAVAAYNAGPGAIHRAVSKSQRTGKDWKEHIPKETQDYIKKVIPEEKETSSEEKTKEHKPIFTDTMGLRG